jgi:hypothetical protein
MSGDCNIGSGTIDGVVWLLSLGVALVAKKTIKHTIDIKSIVDALLEHLGGRFRSLFRRGEVLWNTDQSWTTAAR